MKKILSIIWDCLQVLFTLILGFVVIMGVILSGGAVFTGILSDNGTMILYGTPGTLVFIGMIIYSLKTP